jgi:hypothetical protein
LDEFRKVSANIRKENVKIIEEILNFDDQSSVGPIIREACDLNNTMTDVTNNFLQTNLQEIINNLNHIEERFEKISSDWETYKSE